MSSQIDPKTLFVICQCIWRSVWLNFSYIGKAMRTKIHRSKLARVRHLTPNEAKRFFDREARRTLGMPGDKFIRDWTAGKFNGKSESPEVMHLAILMPFGR